MFKCWAVEIQPSRVGYKVKFLKGVHFFDIFDLTPQWLVILPGRKKPKIAPYIVYVPPKFHRNW